MRQFVQLMANTEMENSKSTKYLEQIANDIELMATVMINQEFHGAFKEFFPKKAQIQCYINGLMQYLALEGVSLQHKQTAASVVGLFTKINPQKLETRYLATVYFKMFTNWRIPIAVKHILRKGFTLFIQQRWEELSGMFQFISIKLSNLLEAAQSHGIGQSGQSFRLDQINHDLIAESSFLMVQFPQDIDPAYDSLFLLVDSLIEANFITQGFEHNINSLLLTLRLLLRNFVISNRQKSLVRMKRLFIILEQFMTELEKHKNREAKVREEVGKWEELGSLFSEFYRYNAYQMNGSFNLLLTTKQSDDKTLFQIKQDAANAHLAILNLLQNHHSHKIFEQLTEMANDLLLSLDYLANNYEALPIYQTGLGQAFLSLLTALIKKNQVSSEWMIRIIKRILLPIFYLEIELHRETLIDDPSELYFILEDCCCSQNSQIMLTELCKCFEEMAQKDEQNIINFAFEYLNYTLRRRQAQIRQQDNIQGHFPTACLMLSVVSYRPNGFLNYKHVLKQILASDLFNQLQHLNKAYFYFLYESLWHQIYPPLDSSGEQFLISCTQSQILYQLSFFSLHFLFETVTPSQYSERFVAQFLLGFSRLGNFQVKWQVLNKIIRSFIDRISAAIVIQLIEQLNYRTLLQLNEIFKKNDIKERAYSNEMSHTVELCRQIAIEHDFCKQNEEIGKGIIRVVVSLLPHSCTLHLDEEVIRLACEVIDISQRISIDQINLIEMIATAYRENEYRGNSYFQLISRYIQYSEDPIVAANIFEILIEAFSYYIYFPEEDMMEDNLTNYSGNVILLQNMLLKSGNLLSGERHFISIITDQFKRSRSNLLQKFPDCTLVAKLHILMLLASYYMQLPIQSKYLIVDADLFRGYDASLLIYVIGKLQSTLPQSTQMLFLQLSLLILQNNQAQNTKQSASHLYRSKIDQPLNFIEPVVILQTSIRQEFLEYVNSNNVKSLILRLPDREKNQLIRLMEAKPENTIGRPYLKIMKKREQLDASALDEYSDKVIKRRRQDSSDEDEAYKNRGKHKHNNRHNQ